MGKFRRLLIRIFFMPKITMLLLVVLSVCLLTFVFVKGLEENIFSYFVYVLSFYTLCVVAVNIPKVIKCTKKFLYGNVYTSRYLSEVELRLRITLFNGTLISFVYGIFKFVMGVFYNSFWFGAVAVYYIVLCLIRYLLVKNEKKSSTIEENKYRLLHEWKSYRISGILLLLLNAAISIIALRVVFRNDGYSYPGFVIYAAAAFTFYRVSMSIARLVKKKKNSRPVFAAAGALDLSISLMSLFSLQTAMFSSFGGDMSERTIMIMNGCTGTAVSVLVVFVAIFMIVKSTNEIKEKTNG